MNESDSNNIEPPIDADASNKQIERWKDLSQGNSIALNTGKPNGITNVLEEAFEDKESGPFRETYAYWAAEHCKKIDPIKSIPIFEKALTFGRDEGSICSHRTPGGAASQSGASVVLEQKGPESAIEWIETHWDLKNAAHETLKAIADRFEKQGELQTALEVLRNRMDEEIRQGPITSSQKAFREHFRIEKGLKGLTNSEIQKLIITALKRKNSKALHDLPLSTQFAVGFGCHSQYIESKEFMGMLADDLECSSVEYLFDQSYENELRVFTSGWSGKWFGDGVRFCIRKRGESWFLDEIVLHGNQREYVKSLGKPKPETNSPLPFPILAPWDKQNTENRKSFLAGGQGDRNQDPFSVHVTEAPWWSWFIPAGPTIWNSITNSPIPFSHIRNLMSRCGYGPRGFYYNQWPTHTEDNAFAIDFTSYDGMREASEYTTVLAALEGRVISATFNWEDHNGDEKNFVEIVSRNRRRYYAHRYLHLAKELSPPVMCGSYVLAEQYLGRMQDTGNSIMPHLHFSMHDQSRPYGGINMGACGSIPKGRSVRPYPMARQTLRDQDRSSCITSNSGGRLSVEINSPGDGDLLRAGEIAFLSANVNGGAFPMTINWRSDREGRQGSLPVRSNRSLRFAPIELSEYGNHDITVSVRDAVGRRASDTSTISILPGRPRFSIITPGDGESFATNEYVPLQGRSFNDETDEPFREQDVRWRNLDSGEDFGDRHNAAIPPDTLTPGLHRVAFEVGVTGEFTTREFRIVDAIASPRPYAVILWPLDGTIIDLEIDPVSGLGFKDVRFSGRGFSLSGSIIRSDDMIWTLISPDGIRVPIGTGITRVARLTNIDLTITRWRVELFITDSNGNSASAQVEVPAKLF